MYKDQRLTSTILLFSTLFLETGSLSEPRTHKLARPTDKQVPESTYLSLVPSTRLTEVHNTTPDFYLVLGIST